MDIILRYTARVKLRDENWFFTNKDEFSVIGECAVCPLGGPAGSESTYLAVGKGSAVFDQECNDCA